jgi:hypothetical protein
LNGRSERFTLWDVVANEYRGSEETRVFEVLERAASMVLTRCRGLEQVEDGHWRPPNGGQQQARWRPRNVEREGNAVRQQVRNPEYQRREREVAIARNRAGGRGVRGVLNPPPLAGIG